MGKSKQKQTKTNKEQNDTYDMDHFIEEIGRLKRIIDVQNKLLALYEKKIPNAFVVEAKRTLNYQGVQV